MDDYEIIRKDPAPGFDHLGCYTEYICDATAKVASVPTGANEDGRQLRPRPGSMLICTNPPSLYTLNTQRVWTKLWGD